MPENRRFLRKQLGDVRSDGSPWVYPYNDVLANEVGYIECTKDGDLITPQAEAPQEKEVFQHGEESYRVEWICRAMRSLPRVEDEPDHFTTAGQPKVASVLTALRTLNDDMEEPFEGLTTEERDFCWAIVSSERQG